MGASRALRAWCAVFGVGSLLAVTGCGPQAVRAQEPGRTDRNETPLRRVLVTTDSFYGAFFHADFAFDSDRQVVNASYVAMGASSSSMVLWPPDWPDEDKTPPRRPRIEAGERFSAEAGVVPTCDGRVHAMPELVLTTRTDEGTLVEERYDVVMKGTTAEETLLYLQDFTDLFCGGGVQAAAGSYRISADRDEVRITYRIRNPGPETVTVTSHAWRNGTARWLPASVEVPADGSTTNLTLHGVGGICDSSGRDGPLLLGLLAASTGDGAASTSVRDADEGTTPACQ